MVFDTANGFAGVWHFAEGGTGNRLDATIKLSQPESIVMYSPQGKPTSILTYFVAKINSLDDIGLDQEVLPKFMLQLSEIDWAGFITIEEAYATIQQAQLIILDRLRG
jgi:hypothetical protein